MAEFASFILVISIADVMGLITRPLMTMDEKATFLEEASSWRNMFLFLEHDGLKMNAAQWQMTDRGVTIDKTFRLDEI